MKIVLDANAAIDWFIPTPEGEAYSSHLIPLVNSGDIRFVVPLHFDIEVTAHLVKKHRRLPQQYPINWLNTTLDVLDALPIDITGQGINFSLLGKLAATYSLTPYDVPYFQLARLMEIPIATRDRGIISASKHWHVLHWQLKGKNGHGR